MGLIAVEGMAFNAHHGVYEEEQITGKEFVIDVYIKYGFGAAAKADDLFKTINYETIYLICQAEMKKPVNLLETLAERIIEALKHQFNRMQEVKVRIRKKRPLPSAQVESAYIESEASFRTKCGRCGKGMVCYNDPNCWCMDKQIHPKTQELLKTQYRGCLCKDCLTVYEG